jgi:hypothetical protein
MCNCTQRRPLGHWGPTEAVAGIARLISQRVHPRHLDLRDCALALRLRTPHLPLRQGQPGQRRPSDRCVSVVASAAELGGFPPLTRTQLTGLAVGLAWTLTQQEHYTR